MQLISCCITPNGMKLSFLTNWIASVILKFLFTILASLQSANQQMTVTDMGYCFNNCYISWPCTSWKTTTTTKLKSSPIIEVCPLTPVLLTSWLFTLSSMLAHTLHMSARCHVTLLQEKNRTKLVQTFFWIKKGHFKEKYKKSGIE